MREREEDLNPSEISERQIASAKKLIRIAMLRLKESKVTKEGSRHSQTAVFTIGEEIYKLMDEHVRISGKGSRAKWVPDGPLDEGLRVIGYRKDKDGKFSIRFIAVELPRYQGVAEKENLESLRGFEPEDIEVLASNLRKAKQIHQTEFPRPKNSIFNFNMYREARRVKKNNN